MATERKILILWCIIASVDHKLGVRSRVEKYPVHATGKNFVPVPYNPGADNNEYSWEDGFNGMLRGRVPINGLMKVYESDFMRDSHQSVRRHIYFFDTGFGDAKKMVAQAIEKKIGEIRDQANALHDQWINRAHGTPNDSSVNIRA